MVSILHFVAVLQTAKEAANLQVFGGTKNSSQIFFGNVDFTLIDVVEQVTKLVWRTFVNHDADEILFGSTVTCRKSDAEDRLFKVRGRSAQHHFVSPKVSTLDKNIDVKKKLFLKKQKRSLLDSQEFY